MEGGGGHKKISSLVCRPDVACMHMMPLSKLWKIMVIFRGIFIYFSLFLVNKLVRIICASTYTLFFSNIARYYMIRLVRLRTGRNRSVLFFFNNILFFVGPPYANYLIRDSI